MWTESLVVATFCVATTFHDVAYCELILRKSNYSKRFSIIQTILFQKLPTIKWKKQFSKMYANAFTFDADSMWVFTTLWNHVNIPWPETYYGVRCVCLLRVAIHVVRILYMYTGYRCIADVYLLQTAYSSVSLCACVCLWVC